MTAATLTSKGQLTIPKKIREYLGVHQGDRLDFIVNDEGKVIVEASTLDVSDIYGMIQTKKQVSVEDMNKAVVRRAHKRHKK